ncbi:methyl-accepting chemotaxis protein [Wukongibacter sp. M2B1]|uniref:methyl-accepting chemotaxis protein n=1 Tax=Wukongibacter sp. M2B1 TaxID=3088895 RepID=UPI003D795A5A
MKSIRNIVILAIVAFTVLISFFQIGFSIFNFNKLIKGEVNEKLKLKAEKEAAFIYSKFSKWGEASEGYASVIGVMPGYDTDTILNILKRHIENDQLLVGGGFWLEPYEYDTEHKYYGPYMYRNGNKIITTWDYSTAEEDYFKYDWYKSGFEMDKSVIWSEPYADAVTEVPMITATSAIEKGNKKVGVITLDIGLEELQEYVANIKIGENGYGFIITGEGYYLANRNTEKNLNMKITDEEDNELKELGNYILSESESKITQIEVEGIKYLSGFNAIGDTGLKLVVFMPQAEIFKEVNRTFLVNTTILLISVILLIVFLSQLITRIVINPLKIIIKDAERIADGDLTNQDNLVQYIGKKHEIGLLARSFINMVENMQRLISEIKNSADHVSTSCRDVKEVSSGVRVASEQIAMTISELADGISEQAINTQSSNTMVAGIIEKLKDVTINAKDCEELTGDTMEIMEDSSNKIKYQRDKMSESKNATIKVSRAINNLSNKSIEIGEIVNTIDGIAEQTNLLALNAAIEAARAGEAGSGFAVVAEEVRKLAEQSSNSTQKINALIKEIQNGIENAVEEMKTTEIIIEDQEKSVEETVKSFDKIILSVQEVSNKIHTVADNSDELNRNAEEVVGNIENLASISEESAAATEEVAATTQENTSAIQTIGDEVDTLIDVVDRLEKSADKFKI